MQAWSCLAGANRQVLSCLMNWEYKVLDLMEGNEPEWEGNNVARFVPFGTKAMNTLGKEGWELVGVIPMPQNLDHLCGRAFFKRPE